MDIKIARSRISVKAAAALALAAALLFFALYSAWWLSLSRLMKQSLDDWAAQRMAAGWTVTTGSRATRGFPGPVRLVLDAPSVMDAAGNRWQGPELSVSLSPLHPDHVKILAPGRHILTLAHGLPVEIKARQAGVVVALSPAGWRQADLSLAGVEAFGGRLEAATAVLTRLTASGRPVDERTASFRLRFDLAGLTLPDLPGLALGRSLRSATLQARLMGAPGKGDLKSALAAWRDGGGTLEVDRLALDWPPFTLEGQGTLALDDAMQPMFSSSCAVGGLFEGLNRLAQSGVVRRQDAMMAHMVLNALAHPGPDGQPRVTVPLSLQRQSLYLGPLRLLTVAKLPW
ncbi:hypothetical protein GALL_243770 [mine drainage metagenome]|uniref:DUF2125 domain-containing protein n=1 Tax=mine drainage metagenome TaxID=410659 RepID=A0A1J5RC85_9ZZZZ